MVTRVVHVVTKGDVGGAQTHVVELALAQHAAGMIVTVVAGSDGPAMERLRNGGVSTTIVARLVEAGPLGARATMRDLRRTLEALVPDIVHGHSSVAGLLSRIVSRRLGIASVYTAHGWPFQAGARWRQRAMSLLGELVGGRIGGGVICLTPHETALARRWRVVAPDRLWTIANGLGDVDASLVRSRRAAAPLRLMMVARFAPPKLQAELIDVLTRLPAAGWTMTFVGDGPELTTCRARAEQASIEGQVEFAGHRDDVGPLLASADVLLLWSSYEGMPISLLEGMRAGVCCLASALPGVNQLFGDDGGITAADAPALAAQLRALMANPSICDEVGRRARRRFVAEYSIETMSRRTLEVYQTIVSEGDVRLPKRSR